MPDEKYFIYHNGINHYDFSMFSSKRQAEQKAEEILKDDDKKVGTVWIGQLISIARRQVIFDKD